MKSPEVFYLHIQGEQRGPYTVHHIDHLLNSGLITEDALFWREGLEQWQPVTNLVARRKKTRSYFKPAALLTVFVVLAIFLRMFGPITLDGWRESAQTAYTEHAAYWKARDFARHQAGNDVVVQFYNEKSARVQLRPPDTATAVVKGKVLESRGPAREAAWRVDLQYDTRRKEWTTRGVEEVIPQS